MLFQTDFNLLPFFLSSVCKLSYYFRPNSLFFPFFFQNFRFTRNGSINSCPLTGFQSSYSSLSFSLAHTPFESFLSISIDGCKVQRISGGSSHCSRPFRSACVPRNYPRFRFFSLFLLLCLYSLRTAIVMIQRFQRVVFSFFYLYPTRIRFYLPTF